MQFFLFGALAISLAAVVFALQNNVPVTVVVLAWRLQGSLALVLFLALAAGALISLFASLPTLIRGRMAATQHRKHLAALEASLADTQRRLQQAQAQLQPPGLGKPVVPGPVEPYRP